jgi:hypothetical protein
LNPACHLQLTCHSNTEGVAASRQVQQQQQTRGVATIGDSPAAVVHV